MSLKELVKAENKAAEPIKADKWKNLFLCSIHGSIPGGAIYTSSADAKKVADIAMSWPKHEFVRHGDGTLCRVGLRTAIFQIPWKES